MMAFPFGEGRDDPNPPEGWAYKDLIFENDL